MKIVFITVLIGIFTSCGSKEQSSELLGRWISIPNEVFDETGTIHFMADSLVSFPPNGIAFKGAYQYRNGLLSVSGVSDFIWGNPWGNGFEKEIVIKNDTLSWGNDRLYFRTKHKTYLEYFANSKGLTIELPESEVFNRVASNYEFLDFFLGFKENRKIGVVINEEPAEYFQTYERIKALQDSLGYMSLAFRIFADKNIEMAYIDDIHTTMERMNIRRVLYVTKNLARSTSSVDDFSGIESFRPSVRLVEIKEDI